MEKMKYYKINKNKLKKYFDIEYDKNIMILKYKWRARNIIKIRYPIILDEEYATLLGLMPDGSLIKDLRRIYFSQEKDKNKLYFFRDLIYKKFSPNNKVFIKPEEDEAYINSTTLARFYYHILRLPKSNQQMRIPYWIFDSPRSVKLSYLREAYAMEGTILKSLNEIRFITKDKKFGVDIRKLLKTIGISATLNQRIGGTHKTTQYRISVYGRENFKRFKEIGFTYPMHVNRFEQMIKKYSI